MPLHHNKNNETALVHQGRFIALEGGEGAGKSTQAKALAAYLQKRGHEVLVTREPGGTPGAEAVRRLLVEGAAFAWPPVSELLLFLAARYDHVQKVIRPALARGVWVVSDRYQDSTTVYQGAGRGLGMGYVDGLYRSVFGAFHTDMTCILDIPAAQGVQRARASADAVAGDPFESEALAFHQRIQQGFRELAETQPGRCVMVDASGTPEEVTARLVAAVEARVGHGAA